MTEIEYLLNLLDGIKRTTEWSSQRSQFVCLGLLQRQFNKAVPPNLLKPRQKEKIRRELRLRWLSWLVGRSLSTSKELTKEETLTILDWLTGLKPGSERQEDIDETLAANRSKELRAWLQ